jgi:AcrR family transcriptional regulator
MTRVGPEEVMALFGEYCGGKSIQQVAREAGVSTAALYSRFRRHGLTLDRDDRRGPGDKSGVKDVSFLDANRLRAVRAGQRSVQALRDMDTTGLSELERQVVSLRTKHPDLSFTELGALCRPPMTKFAYAARLRRVLAKHDRG